MHHDEEVRIALMEHETGTSSGIWIKGQVMDVDAEPYQTAVEDWDPYTGLLIDSQDSITPYRDYSIDQVMKPILSLEIHEKSNRKVFTIPYLKGNEDGTFEYLTRPNLPAGEYEVVVRCTGTASILQEMDDALHFRHNNCPIRNTRRIIGRGRLRILPQDYDGIYVTSDIDQTYLQTDIKSSRGLLSTLFQTPADKMSYSGMASLYRALKNGIEGMENNPITFISASPSFFRRTLYRKFDLENIGFERVILKPITGILAQLAKNAFKQLASIPYSEIVSGASFGIVWSFFEDSYINITQQVAYKLEALLEQRLLLPKNTKEILIGDNMEADYFIFSLYQAIITGRFSLSILEESLRVIEFNKTKVVPVDQVPYIIKLARKILEKHGVTNSVKAVLIHEAIPMPDEKEMRDKNSIYAILDKVKDFCPVIGYNSSLQAGLYLWKKGFINEMEVVSITKSIFGDDIKGEIVNDKFIRNEINNFSHLSKKEKEYILNILYEKNLIVK